jgi:hypothetical protein
MPSGFESRRVRLDAHTSFPETVCGDILIAKDPEALPPGAKRVETAWYREILNRLAAGAAVEGRLRPESSVSRAALAHPRTTVTQSDRSSD